MITLNSDYGESLNGSKKSSVMFNFNSILSDELLVRAYISVMNAQIPSSFYVINETNNQLLYTYNNNNNLTISIGFGNYTSYSIITALNTAFANNATPIIVSNNKLTGILTFTAPYGYTFLNSPNTIMFILGLLDNIPFTPSPILLGFKMTAVAGRTYPFTVNISNNKIPLNATLILGGPYQILTVPSRRYISASALVIAINIAIKSTILPIFPLNLVCSSLPSGAIVFTAMGNNPFNIIYGSPSSMLNSIAILDEVATGIYQTNPYIENTSLITYYYQGLLAPIYPIVIDQLTNSFTLSGTIYEATYTLPDGTYNQSQLITAIQLLFDTTGAIPPLIINALPSGILVISSWTGITTSVPFQVLSPEFSATVKLGFTNIAGYLIGIGVNYTYTYPDYIISTGITTAKFPLNLLGIKTISIHSSKLAISSYSSKNLGINDTLITIPVNTRPFGLIYYKSKNALSKNILTSNSIEAIDIQLTDEDDNLINFNNINWSITLCLSIERE